jgi:hypothetical protein
MSYVDYPQDEWNNFRQIQLHEMEDINTTNCLNLRDRTECMNCIAQMDTAPRQFGLTFSHLAGDLDDRAKLCQPPYAGTAFEGQGFQFPYLIGQETRLFGSPRRTCSMDEHNHIQRCLLAAANVNDDENICLNECIPTILNLQRVGQRLPGTHSDLEQLEKVVPSCVPYSAEEIAASGIDVEPIPDNYLEQIVQGCGEANSIYGRILRWNNNKHLCTDRLKITEPCNAVSPHDFSGSPACDYLASREPGQDHDNPNFTYTLCERDPADRNRCRNKTNPDGTDAVCNNHLRKCSFVEWDDRVRIETAEGRSRNDVWCYESAQPIPKCSNSYNHDCPSGQFLVQDKFFDPLCPEGGICTTELCCYIPRCATNFDESATPCRQGEEYLASNANRRCETETCTPAECCSAPH